ncbi:similar to Saccharomyces cerevisiae YGR244C LSC2 Beta subunit of succinyl-CoA ligase [Maudiozyma saulgeensis]|uniref:Succinate--CoA ligase [ADP-forming] subunit beta, mitochondrial n=1 Tax=Maudiozyma saulgeensis TaxID=1789683 RepID=A0A1X7RAY6_9SACH|nr:similar to Saccharomyces cerevisiae YGR244C LSC2 Beta subunit of succinyl-CoA ligase [Kazachstania saulgeensis]
MLRNALKGQARLVFKRNLSIHEYRSSQLLGQYSIPHPRGSIAFSPEEAEQVAHNLNVGTVVLKAQALTGGRGKGHFLESGLKGGVKMVNSSDKTEIKNLTKQMLGNHLITKQSGPKGKFVSGVYVVEKIDAIKESYLSIILDRSTRTPVIVCSSEGGVNIEETAEKNPKAIKKFHVDPKQGLTDIQAHKIAKSLGFSSKTENDTAETVKKLYKIFMERDATQVEINPLSEVTDGRVMCMDAKFGFDDNASFRQEEVFSWRDLTQEDPDEVKAKKFDLNFVKLQGNIGCLVNGAGLAMATMDVIKLNGGDPANFLDCGGGATPETIKKAFELILSNEKVDAIFVNIFGGIVRCDHVALGLVNAAKELDVKVPIVARLQGTKLAEGKEIIKQSGISIHSFAELDPAAKTVVELAHAHV